MNESIRILLCEDEENLGLILEELLTSKKFVVDRCTDGVAGWEAFKSRRYDLCLLDIMMPKRDGLTLAKVIRSVSQDVPIIFLTALGMRENVLEGFRSGADDYIAKPFSMEELLLRVEAVLRRSRSESTRAMQHEYHLGRYTFNVTSQTLEIGETKRKLTTKECELLTLLCQFANQTLERSHALSVIWGVSDPGAGDFTQRSMDVYVTKLRRMLEEDERVEIKNVHGKGYKLVLPPEESVL